MLLEICNNVADQYRKQGGPTNAIHNYMDKVVT